MLKTLRLRDFDCLYYPAISGLIWGREMQRGPGGLWQRGVHVAPWQGPEGELVLIAIDSHRGLLPDSITVIPHGASRVDASDALWEFLEQLDPIDDSARAKIARVSLYAL